VNNEKRILKYRGKFCAVCGKWGADDPYGEPLLALIHQAGMLGFTLRASQASTPEQSAARGIHPKCLSKLKTLIRYKNGTSVYGQFADPKSCGPADG